MLKQRVLTAIPLAALVIWGILTQPVDIIFYSLLLVIFIAGWEWSALSGISNKVLRLFYASIIVIASYCAKEYIEEQQQFVTPVLSLVILGWLVAIYHMFVNGPGAINKSFSVVKFLIGFVCLVPPVFSLVLI